MERVQAAAATFRRSGALVALEGDEKRIFDAVVKPERRTAGDDGAVEAERERLRKEIARSEGMLANERFVAKAPAGGRRGRARRSSSGTGVSSRRSTADDPVAWLESLSPWPEEFGLGRMRELLASLGDPQLAYPAIHVVGTNGKTSTTLMTAALLRDAGLRVGAYISPHVRGWAERIQVDGADADISRGARARPAARRAGRDAVRGDHGGRPRRVRRARGSTSRSSRRASAGGSTRRTSSRPTSSSSRTSPSSTPRCSATTREEIASREARRRQPGSGRRARRAGVGGPRAGRRRSPRRRRVALEPRARRRCRRGVPRPRGRPGGRRGRQRARPARAPLRASARDLGRRPQPRRRRLPARAASRADVRDRRLDPRRQAPRGDAPGADAARRHARRDHVREPSRAAGRGARRASRGRTSSASRPSRDPVDAHSPGRARLPGRMVPFL